MLNKLYYVYGLDTACFYTDEECIEEAKLSTFRQIKQYITNKNKDNPDETYKIENKIITKRVNKQKEVLKQEIAKNIDTTRTARRDKLIDRDGNPAMTRRVGIFDSTLTRAFKLKEREFNDEIMIIKIYYFDVAKSIIENGFWWNEHKYVFFSSSAGQIRTKKLVAVREDLLQANWNKLTCGLTIDKINEQGGMVICKYLAYIALTNSATDEWVNFDIDRCIVVDDFENDVEGEVDFIDHESFEITRKVDKLPFTHTDGCGMILPEVSKKNFMLRLPFVKGLLASFDFRRFIEEHGCSPVVKDVYGDEHDIVEENIQIILTKSQFKMWKYYSDWKSYKDNFKKYKCSAGICNLEDDDFPDSVINYQMIQTLSDLTDAEIRSLGYQNDFDLTNVVSNPKTMLKVFGAVPWNKNKTGFQKCLEAYPELLSDSYSRTTLKEIKDKLERDLWSARFDIGGKYTFVVPDLYAFCEYLFMGEENPKGLLQNGEVCCKLFEDGEKLDCLRSPHLYIEHPIRVNKTNTDWFNTKAIYVSCHDMISRIVQLDWDGDKLLVTNHPTLIKVAERNNKEKNVVPLFYFMGKAKAEQITPENLYKGLTLAFTGGNIGSPSNDITKIWNSGDISEEALKAVKWLVMMVNHIIDFAKTLYKPEVPDYADSIIKSYVKKKVPNFFIYAKGKDENQVEPINRSAVNRIQKIFPKKNLNFNFASTNLGKFDYKMLLNNPAAVSNQEMYKYYKNLVRNLRFDTNNDRLSDTDKSLYNYNAVYDDCRRKFYQWGIDRGIEPVDLLDSLIIHIFTISRTSRKKAFWTMFGDDIYKNVEKNINSSFAQCKRCKKRCLNIDNKCLCEKCQRHFKRCKCKMYICEDCGKVVEIPIKKKTPKRCPKCAKRITAHNKDYWRTMNVN